jgi:hypothetical protein
MKVKSKKQVSYGTLLKKAQRLFNCWIRSRDEGKPCISCGSFNTAHASHFYAAGSYTGLRFNELNCHASCVSCNTFKGGNIHEYRKRLVERIGEENLQKLDLSASLNRFKKYSRFDLELIIEMYKNKVL